jgi:hypothetical protein
MERLRCLTPTRATLPRWCLTPPDPTKRQHADTDASHAAAVVSDTARPSETAARRPELEALPDQLGEAALAPEGCKVRIHAS